jgi:hypothetical protein
MKLLDATQGFDKPLTQERLSEILEKTQKGAGDVTDWLIWFLGCFSRAIERSEELNVRRKLSTDCWMKGRRDLWEV